MIEIRLKITEAMQTCGSLPFLDTWFFLETPTFYGFPVSKPEIMWGQVQMRSMAVRVYSIGRESTTLRVIHVRWRQMQRGVIAQNPDRLTCGTLRLT